MNKTLLIVISLLASASFFWITYTPWLEGDTAALLQGARGMYDCLLRGQYSGCTIVHFPLSQFLPNLLLIRLGFTDAEIHHWLAYFSFWAFLGHLLLIYYLVATHLSKSAALIILAVFLSGYDIWYSRSSFNEMMASLWILTFVVACLKRWPPIVIVLLFFLAGITKEVSPPFLLVMGWLALYRFRWLPVKADLPWVIALLLGFAVAIAANVGFNYFRYAQFYNVMLQAPHFIVPSFEIWLSYFLALWAAPNGGLVFAWTTWCLLALILFALVIRENLNTPRELLLINFLPFLVFGGLLIILHVGLAKWWSSFGWMAWGPRLTFPYLAGLLILVVYFYKEPMLIITHAMVSNPYRVMIASLVLAILSVPHILLLVHPSTLFGMLFAPMEDFPRYTNPDPANPIVSWKLFAMGTHEGYWVRESIFLRSFQLLKDTWTLWLVMLYCAIFPSLLFLASAFQARRFELPSHGAEGNSNSLDNK